MRDIFADACRYRFLREQDATLPGALVVLQRGLAGKAIAWRGMGLDQLCDQLMREQAERERCESPPAVAEGQSDPAAG